MGKALEAVGRNVAKFYLGLLALAVLAYPFIFVLAAIALLAFIFDHIGLSRLLGFPGLLVFVVISFGMALFFSVYVWPHISPVTGKVFDQLLKP